MSSIRRPPCNQAASRCSTSPWHSRIVAAKLPWTKDERASTQAKWAAWPPKIIVPFGPRSRLKSVTETDAREALTRLDPLWDELFPAEQARIVGLLVERVEIGTEGLNVRLRMDGLATLAREITTDIGAAA